MCRVSQDAGESCDIVVIGKSHKMLSAVNAPILWSELAVQGMCDFKKIHAIEAGIKSFITFVIRATVKHFIIDNLVIISEKNFSNQGKIGL